MNSLKEKMFGKSKAKGMEHAIDVLFLRILFREVATVVRNLAEITDMLGMRLQQYHGRDEAAYKYGYELHQKGVQIRVVAVFRSEPEISTVTFDRGR